MRRVEERRTRRSLALSTSLQCLLAYLVEAIDDGDLLNLVEFDFLLRVWTHARPGECVDQKSRLHRRRRRGTDSGRSSSALTIRRRQVSRLGTQVNALTAVERFGEPLLEALGAVEDRRHCDERHQEKVSTDTVTVCLPPRASERPNDGERNDDSTYE